MADIFTNQVPLELQPQIQGINRQQALSQALLQQGMQQPQGQMVSGRYVAPALTQYLQPLFGAYAGSKGLENVEAQQTELAKALRGMKVAEAEKINQAVKNKDWETAQNLISLSETGVGKELAPLLAKYLVPEQLSEKDKEELRLKEMEIKALNNYRNASLGQQKIPMGYRAKPDGTLEPIPGGPADVKAQTVNAGKETVNTLIGNLKSEYDKLLAGGGITSKNQPGIANLPGSIGSSGIGQMAGKLFGTENQSARNTIAQSRPLLLQAIKNATGMSAKQMDSNAELKMYLAAATDPTLDYESNMKALNQLETLYGGGASMGQQLSSQDQEALDWANKNPNDPRATKIKQRLQR